MIHDDLRHSHPEDGHLPFPVRKTKLTYEVGGGPGSQISLRITKTAGTGSFSKDWVALDRVHDLLAKEPTKPIASHTLGPLFKGTSANTPGFVLAVMKHEGLVRPLVDNPRSYERLDGKAFFSEVQSLMGSKPETPKAKTPTMKVTSIAAPRAASPKPAATTKPAEAPKAKPAVYVSEVHGPLVPQPRKPAKRSPAKR